MHVANVEYSETVKKRGQLLEHNLVALDENAFRIPACSPVETGQLQCVSNDRLDRIPALYVKGEEALAEDLRLLVRLDAQSLSRVERSETFLQFAQDIFVHGITSSETARSSMLLDTTAYSLRAKRRWLICTPGPGGRMSPHTPRPLGKLRRHNPGTPGTCFPGAPDTIRTWDLCLSGLAPRPNQPWLGR